MIDVETAGWYEWALIDGIGEVRARRIEAWVRENRPLATIDDLREVPGLPDGWLDAARPFLRLRGSEAPSTRSGERREREMSDR